MATNLKSLTRDELAKFLPNNDAIRRFESLFVEAGITTPGNIDIIFRLLAELDISAGVAGAKAVQANDSLARIATALEMLSLAPPRQIDTFTKTDYIDFDTLPPEPTYAVGRMWWNAAGTLNLGMGGGSITQQVGEETFIYGKASAAITEGQLIQVTGAVGVSGVVTFAPTTAGLLDPSLIIGIATENLALNDFGRVTAFGVVRGINTTGASVGEVWADGDPLWYRTAGGGTLTKVRPVAPNMKTLAAVVINASGGGSGSLQVQLSRGSTLGATDANVEITSPVNKQLLQYDSVAGYWKNVQNLPFPATQIPSADPNTLDDYRKINYTPTVTAGSGTFTSVAAIGRYIKIGSQVSLSFTVTITTNGTAAGSVILTLPIATGSTYAHAGSGLQVTTAKGFTAYAGASSATVSLFNYDGTYPGGSGFILSGSLTYSV